MPLEPGQMLSHYRLVEKIVEEGWEWCGGPAMRSSGGMLR